MNTKNMIGIMCRYFSTKSQEMHMTHEKMNICDSKPGSRYTYTVGTLYSIQSTKSPRVTKVIISIVV